jgi:hypothetical protein
MVGRAIEEAISLFDEFDTPELMFNVMSHVHQSADGENTRAVRDRAMAASYATTKVFYYLGALDRVDAERMRLGRTIGESHRRAEALRGRDRARAEELSFKAFTLAGQQEVTWHFIAVCASQIGRLLPVAAGAVGSAVPAEDVAFLDTFRVLRNHFEHLDERLPGREKKGRLVLSAPDSSRILLGIEVDTQDRIVVNNVAVDVTSRGVARVHRIIEEAIAAIRQACLARLREYLSANPDQIPDRASYVSGFRRAIGTDRVVASPPAGDPATP